MLTLALTGGRGHAVLLSLLPYATVGRGKKARTRSRPPRAQTAQRAQRVGPSCQQTREKRWSLICKSKARAKKKPKKNPIGTIDFIPWPPCVFCLHTCNREASTRNSQFAESSSAIRTLLRWRSLVPLSPDAGVGGNGINFHFPTFTADSDWFSAAFEKRTSAHAFGCACAEGRDRRTPKGHTEGKAVRTMTSLITKSARGKRSGDGREGRSARLERAASIPGRSTGEGKQAKAWSTTSFEKLKSSKDINNCSSSTSPETDPGASSVFPFFTGTRWTSEVDLPLTARP